MTDVTRRRWLRTAWFWIRRYLPAELAGTATMLIAGVAVAALPVPAIVLGIVGSEAEGVGFYAVAGIGVWREQRRRHPALGRLRLAGRVGMLLLFEFGPAELLDTLLVRPLALTVAIVLIADPVWALLAGKVAADVVFYVLAATAFRVTEKTGVRGAERPATWSAERPATRSAEAPATRSAEAPTMRSAATPTTRSAETPRTA